MLAKICVYRAEFILLGFGRGQKGRFALGILAN